MIFKPIGIADDNKRSVASAYRPSDFSDKQYDGVKLMTTPKDRMVVIMRSKVTAPMMWKVTYGFSQIFFRTFAEAVEFCSTRGFKEIKQQEDGR